MTRSVPEWVATHDDQAIPPRVRARVFERCGGRCAVCSRKIGPADAWQADHIVALANGGEHREGNLQVICGWCHKAKTREDVAIKAKGAKVRARHLGIKAPPKMRGRGFPKTEPQHTATRPIIRKSERERHGA